jgi:hypothetical protein
MKNGKISMKKRMLHSPLNYLVKKRNASTPSGVLIKSASPRKIKK